MAKKKPHRPKPIGDPLKKFKQPHEGQDIAPEMRAYLEQAMEQDHRAGLPMRASLFSSPRSGLPDKWFFEKARSLGYMFDSEKSFYEEQIKACFKDQERIPQYVRDFEKFMTLYYPHDSIAKMFGSIESFREALENQLREAQAKGKSVTFGTNTSYRSNENKETSFLDEGKHMFSVRRT